MEFPPQTHNATQNDPARQMMRRALALARCAADAGEVPVGAVVHTAGGDVIGEGHNETVSGNDASAHAEIIALRRACAAVGNYRLPGMCMTVTLEPCLMCVGAILHARLARVFYAAADPKTGACGGVVNLLADLRLNHQTTAHGGMCADEAKLLLTDFFRRRR